MKLEIQLAVQKINKYASGESGDTVEVVERPNGGISIVMADGQRSGRSAKTISNIVVRKAISLIAEGVRDGAVARATHDYLRTHRGGKVSAELIIVSADLATNTIVVSRNARCPILVRRHDDVCWLNSASDAIGIYTNTKPAIDQFPLEAELALVAFTDGVWSSGPQAAGNVDVEVILRRVDPEFTKGADEVAAAILAEALERDDGRPRDDAAVVVMKTVAQTVVSEVRTLAMSFPI
ncbi:MAG: SpoIIE family protein phosphatase [Caldilineaceae bacterium]